MICLYRCYGNPRGGRLFVYLHLTLEKEGARALARTMWPSREHCAHRPGLTKKLFVFFFCRYLFPGVLWGLCRVNTNVALRPASREKCPSWGVRHARSRVGQIHHSCRSPVWIECLLDWSLVPFTQNAVRHGKRWPHFQVRIIQAFRIRFLWHATLYLQIVWRNRFLINFQSFL